jgi:hypothetical protein
MNNRVLVVLAMTMVTSLSVLATSIEDSIAQNDTATNMDNQSSGTINDTSMVDATGSGSIAGVVPRGP